MASLNEIEQRLEYLESKTQHLYIRSELTFIIISTLVQANLIKKDGVKELLENVNLDAFGTPDIAKAERKIFIESLDKVTLS